MSKKTVKHPDHIDISKVSEVYSGRPGCACGCRGKYYLSSRYHKGDKVNDRMVSKVVNLFNENLDKVLDMDGGIYALDLSETRTYTVYMEGWE